MPTRGLWLALVAVAISTHAGLADTYTFTGGGPTTNWSDPANWLDGLVPANDPSTQILLAPASGPITANADAARAAWILNGLAFMPPGSSGNTLTIDPASSLSFTGPSPFIQSTANVTINGNVSSDAPLAFNAYLALNGNISAPSLLLQNGAILLNGTNSLTNGITFAPISTGLDFTAASAAALGNGPLDLEFNGSVVQQVTLHLPGVKDATTSLANPIIVNSHSATAGLVDFEGPGTETGYSFDFPSLTTTGPAELVTLDSVSFDSVSVGGPLSLFGTFALSNVSGAGSMTQIVSTLTLDTANTFTGGTTIQTNGEVVAAATGALSTGPVTNDGVLFLNATGVANSDIAPSTNSTTGAVYYNANAAANGHHITANTINFASTITDLGGDTFALTPNGVLFGNAQVFPLLTRGGNIDLPAGSSIFSDGTLPTIHNLGNNTDLFLGINSLDQVSITVGAGTPWAGVTGLTMGTINANSNFSLLSVALDADILAASPVHVTFLGAGNILNDSVQHDFSGASAFTVASGATLRLNANDVLGGANGTSPVPLDVASGGTLAFVDGSERAINAPLTLHAGATLSFSGDVSGGLKGSGVISRDNGPLTFIIDSPDAFAGPQLTPAFTQAGDTISLGASNIQNLHSLNPAATYIVQSSITQSDDLFLNGGTLQFQSPGFATSNTLSGAGTVHIGEAGETLLAPGDYTQLSANAPFSSIANPIIATGPLTIGATDPNAATGHGPIFLSGNNALARVTVQYAALGVDSPASLANASLTLDHALLFLSSASSPPATVVYNNAITVSGESTLTDHSLLFANVNSASPGSRLTIDTLNLGAPLHVIVGAPTFHITNLHVTADTALISRSFPITIDTLSEDAPHSLLLQGDTGIIGATFRANALSGVAGAITVDNAKFFLAAAQDPASPTTFAVDANATLEFAADYDLSSATDPTLTGAGTVIIDPGVTLTLSIDSAFAGTIEVNGTLFLTGPRDPGSTITTPNFTVRSAPVPEPASLALLAFAAPLLLRRRRIV
jgi:hypothetical protein